MSCAIVSILNYGGCKRVNTTLLEVKKLAVEFQTNFGKVHAVKDFSFIVEQGDTLGIVGESGSGKSIASLAIIDLLPNNATMKAHCLNFQQANLLALHSSSFSRLRGAEIAMIFQNPMTSLNPCFTIKHQLIETLKVHQPHLSRARYRQQAIELLQQVGIPAPAKRLRSYPHELSGGMAQRVIVATALACQPKLLIADEPTTALDVTISRQILDLLVELKQQKAMSMMLITHDLHIVFAYCNKIIVVYAGETVESGNTREVLLKPRHPYTKALLDALPELKHTVRGTELPTIEGHVPSVYEDISGCAFHPRCQYATELCRRTKPTYDLTQERPVKCHYPLT